VCMLPYSLWQMFAFLCSVMVQYHALGVLYHIRKSDRLAVNKLVAKLTRMSLKSPYAVCMLVSIDDFRDFCSCCDN
jgi:Flp pilus assembly protein protease CpaA